MTEGYLFSKEEVAGACRVIETTFGPEYFRQGIKSLKDSDPAGPGMGRWTGGFSTAKLLQAWHRSREELIYADLEGNFRPGVYSVTIGMLGKCLEVLAGSPGLAETAAGLLNDDAFEETFFLLSIAAGFKKCNHPVLFTAAPKNCFFTGNNYLAVCNQASPHTNQPPVCSPAGLLSGIRLPVLGAKDRATAKKQLLYIDFSGMTTPLTALGDRLKTELPALLEGRETEITALLLCRKELHWSTGGIRQKLSCYPVYNTRTPGRLRAEGLNIYFPGRPAGCFLDHTRRNVR